MLREVKGGLSRLATLKPGAFVGQMALVDSAPRSATIRAATEEVVAMELQRDVFEGLLAAASPLAVHFQEQIAVAGIRQLRMADKHFKRLLGSGRPAQKPRLATAASGRGGAVSAALPSRPSVPSRGPTPGREPRKPATDMLAYLQTALTEWGMSVEELDHVSVSTPTGQMSSAEIQARRRR